jgi:hypothetical protein
MLTCRQVTELATDWSEGQLGAVDRRRLEQHLAGCDGCRAFVAQLEATAGALRRLPEAALPPGLEGALLAGFDGWKRERERGATAPARGPAARWPALLLVAPAALLVALGRHPSHEPADWIVGAALAGTAMALAAALRRLTPGFAAAAGSAALVAALARGGAGPLAAATGLHCLATEAGAAAGSALVAWLVLRRGAVPLLRSALGAWAVAGALAADAALQITCADHGSVAHLLAFHATGVLSVVAAGLLASLRRAPAPR